MKPLVLFCFTIFVAVLSVLSCFNFAFEPLDRIEEDKITCVIEKPGSKSNTEFLNDVSEALDAVNADIMFRYLDATGERVHYQYYKTNHTENFVELLSGIDGKPLGNFICFGGWIRQFCPIDEPTAWVRLYQRESTKKGNLYCNHGIKSHFPGILYVFSVYCSAQWNDCLSFYGNSRIFCREDDRICYYPCEHKKYICGKPEGKLYGILFRNC